jgi:integrating conjugative element membrane protein (TIGR03747 family)
VSPAPTQAPKPRTKGPVDLAFEVVMGLFYVSMIAWFVGIGLEIGGGYSFWKDYPATEHARAMVEDDLRHIQAAPRSLLVPDTMAFAAKLMGGVAYPFERMGVLDWQAQHADVLAKPMRSLQMLGDDQTGSPLATKGASKGAIAAFKSTLHSLSEIFGAWALIAMYVAQDVLLRLSVAAFALPAFVLACLVGVVDGLVRRDLRRWGGGRESSFVYHHAKRYTIWSLTGGLGLYLAWPFGGFNPAYMVLVFTLLVAVTMSTTVGAFKKYV